MQSGFGEVWNWSLSSLPESVVRRRDTSELAGESEKPSVHSISGITRGGLRRGL